MSRFGGFQSALGRTGTVLENRVFIKDRQQQQQQQDRHLSNLYNVNNDNSKSYSFRYHKLEAKLEYLNSNSKCFNPRYRLDVCVID